MTMAVAVKNKAEKKPFGQRWDAAAPEAQARFYRMKCRELLAPPRYARITSAEQGALIFMRDNMKKKTNGKAHPAAEKAMAEPLMSC